MKAVVAAFNQEKALVGAFSVIVQPVVEPMDRFTALFTTNRSSVGREGINSFLFSVDINNAAFPSLLECWTIPRPERFGECEV